MFYETKPIVLNHERLHLLNVIPNALNWQILAVCADPAAIL